MTFLPQSRLKLISQCIAWWHEERAASGFLRASNKLTRALWEFLRESTPERKKRRYGDADFDWDHRVNTTSAAVGWKSRLLGSLYSEYQPTEAAAFREMIGSLEIDFSQFTFIDIGSGKGRVLLMAADFPFRSIVGVELLPELHAVALDNLRRLSDKSSSVVAVCADATSFEFPLDPLVVYLFHPLPEWGLRKLMENLTRSVAQHPRDVLVVYHNPVFSALVESAGFKKVMFRDQFAVYASSPTIVSNPQLFPSSEPLRL